MPEIDATSLLRERGLRATPARMALLAALQKFEKPVSVEELHAVLPSIHLVTIYRIVQTLVAAKLAHAVRFKDGITRYEHFETAHHHHLVCTSCGLIDDIGECATNLERMALSKTRRFATIEEHTLEFFGTCVSCAQQP